MENTFTHILTILWYDSTSGMEMWIQVVKSFDLAKFQSSYSSGYLLNFERKMIFNQKAGKAIPHVYISDRWMTMADTKRTPAIRSIVSEKKLNLLFSR
jgi:hypothetical protein